MPSFNDITGQVFGRLTVVRRAGVDAAGSAKWVCCCACGAERIVSGASLRSGRTRSCGCLAREVASATNRTHGGTRQADGRKTPEYAIWTAMRQRCENPKHPKFERYGGRGITVCERWRSFENFASDMGPQPPGLTIERRENDGNYEPDNCHWAPQQEQARNRHNSILVEIEGRTLCLSEWARHFGVHIATVQARMRKGATALEALKRPLRGG